MSFYPWFPELHYKQTSPSFWAARIQHWSVRHQWIVYVFVYMDRVHRVQSTYICRFTYTYTLKNLFQSLLWKKLRGKHQFRQSDLNLHMWGGANSRCNSLFSLSVPPVAPFSMAHVPSPMLALHPQCSTLCFLPLWITDSCIPVYINICQDYFVPCVSSTHWAMWMSIDFFFLFFSPVHGFLNWFLFGKWQCPSDMTYFFQAVLAGCSTPS